MSHTEGEKLDIGDKKGDRTNHLGGGGEVLKTEVFYILPPTNLSTS